MTDTTPQFPENVRYTKNRAFGRLGAENLEAGEHVQVAAEYSDYLMDRGGYKLAGYQPAILVFDQERYVNDLDMARREARMHNADKSADMHIWRRKIVYGEWELVETIPAKETVEGWY